MAKKGAEPLHLVCAASLDTLSPSQMMEIYQYSGCPGGCCPTLFVRSVSPSMVKSAIGTCVKCTTIAPAPVNWEWE